ncbi:MAG: BspA family leucine-rich repeat surface protein [Bacilli bacterium]|nr:BspA family leucine-rich repeat surface protein [Bacilli bacterium]
MNQKKVIIIFVVLGIIFTVLGGTLAYWNWSSTNAQKTVVTFTATAGMSCSADGGGNITNEVKIAPSTCTDTNYAIIRPITVSTTTNTADELINVSMNLHIDSIAQELLDSDYFMYALTESNSSCANPIQGGSFGDNIDPQTNNIPLLIDQGFVGNETNTYYLYIWLDSAETNLNTMNKSFSASLTGECEDTGTTFIRKNYANLGTSGAYFKATAYKDNITSISFVNEINIPENATNWNVGVSPSNASDVKAWLEDDGYGNNTYALKIGSRGTVFATSLSEAFYNMGKVNNVDFTYLNTSETANMRRMFGKLSNTASRFTLNLGPNFNTVNVTDMYGMFAAFPYCVNLGPNFDTSNVTTMKGMFSMAARMCCTNDLHYGLNLGDKFNTINVTDMSYMFNLTGDSAGCQNFTLNLGNHFNTSNVTNMYKMFEESAYMANTISLNLGNNFDTSNVTNMGYMFGYIGDRAKNVSVNLGNKFNMSKVADASYAFWNTFRYANTPFTLDLAAGNFSNITNNSGMFLNFGNNKATIYVKDTTSRNFIIAQNSNFSASNVLIK